MVNEVTIIGNLGRDPELRSTNSGTAICKLSVATTSRVKRNDTWEDETEWHTCTCFGRTAENASQYLQKGRQVYIKGRIKTTKSEKDGQTRYFTEIIVNELRFLGGKSEGSDGGSSRGRSGSRGGSSGGSRGYSNPPPTTQNDYNDMPYSDDDIPF